MPFKGSLKEGQKQPAAEIPKIEKGGRERFSFVEHKLTRQKHRNYCFALENAFFNLQKNFKNLPFNKGKCFS